MSKTTPYRDKVEIAGYTATYLRLWRQWVVHEDGLTINTNFITMEAFKDILMSCHFVVLLIKYFAVHHPTMDVPLWRTGSDVCEDLFSALGSMVMNKRTYTLLEAIVTCRNKMQLSVLEASGGLVIPKKARRKPSPFVEDGQRLGPGQEYPSEDALQACWKAGEDRARRDLQEDEMRPRWQRNQYPDWWQKPQLFDPKSGNMSMGEEDLLEENDEPVDQEDDCDDDDGSGAGDGHSDDSSDGWSDDSELLMPLDVIDQASMLVMVRGSEAMANDAKISQKVRLPGRTNSDCSRVHKRTVCKWINDGRAKLSADRGLRVQQARQAGLGHGDDGPVFNIREDDWSVGLHSDVAVMFGDNGCVGKIIRMRQKHGKRWVNYTRPVIIHNDRTPLGELYFTCHWYTRSRRGLRNDMNFVFNQSSADEVHVSSLVCPVNMTYDNATRMYTMDIEHARIVRRSLRGQVSWDPSGTA